MRRLVLVAASLLVPSLGVAEGPVLEPGQWEITTTVTTPMMPNPRTEVSTRCITEQEAAADPLEDLVEAGGCTVTERATQDNTLEFAVECSQGATRSTGRGAFTGEGRTGRGRMEMTTEFQDQSMRMSQSWEMKRLGGC